MLKRSVFDIKLQIIQCLFYVFENQIFLISIWFFKCCLHNIISKFAHKNLIKVYFVAFFLEISNFTHLDVQEILMYLLQNTLHTTKFSISYHFKAILDKLTSISIKRHLFHLRSNLLNQKNSVILLPIF